jgi:hypothetical protein
MITKFRFPAALTVVLFAAAPVGAEISDEQMQQMMQQAYKMQECLAGIDQSGMDALAARADAMEQELKALCAAGKRDEAERTAIKYGQEISAAPEMQAMKDCGEIMQGMMQQMPMMADLEQEYGDQHVCDGMDW